MQYYKITPPNITKLEENEVFVFGTNESGFHGAGAAGYAFRFDQSGNWRNDQFFLDAKNSKIGSEKRIGRWAIYGQSEGLMQGKEGKSYGIITIKFPGQRRSRSLVEIWKSIHNLMMIAKSNTDLHFFVTEIGCNLAGWSVSDIAPFFRNADELQNISIPQSFADWLNKNPPKIII